MTAVLRDAAGRAIAALHPGDDIAAAHAPRPYVTVTTPRGAAVTDTMPEDHRHHFGVSVTTPDVAGTNFWGGSTFVSGVGPSMLDNHGRQTVDEQTVSADGARQLISWWDRHGERVLTERRAIDVRSIAGHPALTWRSSLSAERDGVSIGSSHTNGRPGAFYGGIFWRTPFARADVRTIDGRGAAAAHGSSSPWLIVSGPDTALVAATGSGLPWFVRADGYVGFGPAIAAQSRRAVERGAPLDLDLAVVVIDGAPDDAALDDVVAALLTRTHPEVSA